MVLVRDRLRHVNYQPLINLPLTRSMYVSAPDVVSVRAAAKEASVPLERLDLKFKVADNGSRIV